MQIVVGEKKQIWMLLKMAINQMVKQKVNLAGIQLFETDYGVDGQELKGGGTGEFYQSGDYAFRGYFQAGENCIYDQFAIKLKFLTEEDLAIDDVDDYQGGRGGNQADACYAAEAMELQFIEIEVDLEFQTINRVTKEVIEKEKHYNSLTIIKLEMDVSIRVYHILHPNSITPQFIALFFLFHFYLRYFSLDTSIQSYSSCGLGGEEIRGSLCGGGSHNNFDDYCVCLDQQDGAYKLDADVG
ncbi:MAG: hypothetical protein EZS28_001532 [Streblomastix strix]|uniref:Uncharacterized protein n=1 Tax=Streblomastix strix TaxID=222440 RepID=A0A5J4X8S3_9EUKA|nr:MAG: hypothetical protein EZS28_001532 [Streblomastix strix]